MNIDNDKIPSLKLEHLLFSLIESSRKQPARTGKRGHPQTYDETLVLVMSMCMERFNLSLDGVIALTRQAITLAGDAAAIISRSRLCERRQQLEVIWRCRTRLQGERDLLIDSTCFKLGGSDGWRSNKYPRRRDHRPRGLGRASALPEKPTPERYRVIDPELTRGYRTKKSAHDEDWVKVTLITDKATGEIVGLSISRGSTSDVGKDAFYSAWTSLPDDLSIAHVLADAAYDRRDIRRCITQRASRGAIIKPRMDAIVITNKRMRAERAVKHRNQTIRHICAAGWRDWSRNSGYSQRALVEATMSRSKRAFTSPIRARTDAARRVSATLRVAYLNHNLVPAMNTS